MGKSNWFVWVTRFISVIVLIITAIHLGGVFTNLFQVSLFMLTLEEILVAILLVATFVIAWRTLWHRQTFARSLSVTVAAVIAFVCWAILYEKLPFDIPWYSPRAFLAPRHSILAFFYIFCGLFYALNKFLPRWFPSLQ
jgi:hypothetical protein